MVDVQYDELLAAFEFVSSAAPTEHLAYLSVDTGEIHWISELNPLDEEVPGDLEESDRYISIPHKNDLDLGKQLALDFAASELPAEYARTEGFFRRRGAYRRFKELLAERGCLEKWYAFEAASTDRALSEWCTQHDIHVIRNADEPSA
jgi:hypothetical protein